MRTDGIGNTDGVRPTGGNEATRPQATEPTNRVEAPGTLHNRNELNIAREIVEMTIPDLIRKIDDRRANLIQEAYPNLSERRQVFRMGVERFLSLFLDGNGRPLIPLKDWQRLQEIFVENAERGGYETYASRREKNLMFDLIEKQEGYKTDRSLENYSDCYQAVTGRTIQEKIESMEGTVRVLDEGCGRGKAVAEIKKLYPDKVHTIGLIPRKLAGTAKEVDEIHEAFAEEWLPEQPVDFILSFCGATYYSQDDAKWSLMLKNAYSLSEKGEAMFVLYLDKDLRHYQERDLSKHKKEILEQTKRFFNSRGFEFECKSFPANRFKSIDLPKGDETDVVIIRRKS